MGFEKADLPVGLIGDFERVLAMLQERIGIADIDPHAVFDVFRVIGLVAAIAANGEQVEINIDNTAAAGIQRQRDIPVDAAPDRLPLGIGADRFRDRDGAVPRNLDFGAVGGDLLGGQ